MIKRKLPMVFGILTVIFGMLSLDISGSMAQDTTPPLFPQREVGSHEGYEGSPEWDGSIPINRQDPGNPEVLKQMRELTIEMAKNSNPVPAGGETTLGSTILIAGKQVKLPNDVYIAHFIAGISCLVGATESQCPQAPIYHLRQKGTEFEISISAVNGVIADPNSGSKVMADNRQAFQWLIDVLPDQVK